MKFRPIQVRWPLQSSRSDSISGDVQQMQVCLELLAWVDEVL